jgi:hypothetical protein
MNLPNIPFNEYLKMNLDDGYVYTYSLKFGRYLNKPIDHFGIGDLREKTFGQVKDWQEMFAAGVDITDMPKALALFVTKPLKAIYFQPIVEVAQTFAFIVEQIKDITEVEGIALARRLTDEENTAGVERFEVYGVYPQLRSIATAFHVTINEVKAMPYNDCFVELCYQKDLAEYQLDYSKKKPSI